jgi:membrane fusion protein, heavy metal efflux system
MKRKTVLLAAVFFAGLALGAGGVRHLLGGPDASPREEAADSHGHDVHEQAEKPNAAAPHNDHTESEKEDDHAQEGHHEHEHAEEKIIRLSEDRRKELGIEVAAAQAGSLTTQLRLSGTVALNTDRLIHIVPRIPGIVREVRKNLGDPVRAGEVMAIIDSREPRRHSSGKKTSGKRKSPRPRITSKPSKRWQRRALNGVWPSKSSLSWASQSHR